jgi:GH24 family phage-related lysozyme (muramidase)
MRFKEFKEAFGNDGWDDLIGQSMSSLLSGGKAADLMKSFTGSSKTKTSPTSPTSPTSSSTDTKSKSKSDAIGLDKMSGSGRPSERLIQFIKQKETFSPKAQWDYKQFSNGYGTKAKSRNEVIDEREADRRIREQVQGFYNIVLEFDRAHNYKFNANQLDALTSFVYNGGPGWLNQVSANGSRNKQQIVQAMLQYNTAGGRRLGGLDSRRREEVAMFNAGSNMA